MQKGRSQSIIHPAVRRDQLVTNADLQVFKEDLLLSIARIIKDNTTKSSKKWLKSREVKALLGISNGTLHSLRIGGSLPYSKIGNIFYYDQDDVNQLLANHRKLIPQGGVLPLRRPV